ncbi:MAG: hypothetical protein ACHQJ6_03940 [Candidatus Berkiellales bacterium]
MQGFSFEALRDYLDRMKVKPDHLDRMRDKSASGPLALDDYFPADSFRLRLLKDYFSNPTTLNVDDILKNSYSNDTRNLFWGIMRNFAEGFHEDLQTVLNTVLQLDIQHWRCKHNGRQSGLWFLAVGLARKQKNEEGLHDLGCKVLDRLKGHLTAADLLNRPNKSKEEDPKPVRVIELIASQTDSPPIRAFMLQEVLDRILLVDQNHPSLLSDLVPPLDVIRRKLREGAKELNDEDIKVIKTALKLKHNEQHLVKLDAPPYFGCNEDPGHPPFRGILYKKNTLKYLSLTIIKGLTADTLENCSELLSELLSFIKGGKADEALMKNIVNYLYDNLTFNLPTKCAITRQIYAEKLHGIKMHLMPPGQGFTPQEKESLSAALECLQREMYIDLLIAGRPRKTIKEVINKTLEEPNTLKRRLFLSKIGEYHIQSHFRNVRDFQLSPDRFDIDSISHVDFIGICEREALLYQQDQLALQLGQLTLSLEGVDQALQRQQGFLPDWGRVRDSSEPVLQAIPQAASDSTPGTDGGTLRHH